VRRRLDSAINRLNDRYVSYLGETKLISFHCALIYVGGSLVSTGFNKEKANSFMMAFAHHEFVQSVHAECDAILRVRKKIDLTGSRIYVAKLGRNGNVGNSKPCPMCELVLRRYGIKRVYFTLDEDSYESERIRLS
jgi:deoxycytidylate deaminase